MHAYGDWWYAGDSVALLIGLGAASARLTCFVRPPLFLPRVLSKLGDRGFKRACLAVINSQEVMVPRSSSRVTLCLRRFCFFFFFVSFSFAFVFLGLRVCDSLCLGFLAVHDRGDAHAEWGREG